MIREDDNSPTLVPFGVQPTEVCHESLGLSLLVSRIFDGKNYDLLLSLDQNRIYVVFQLHVIEFVEVYVTIPAGRQESCEVPRGCTVYVLRVHA